MSLTTLQRTVGNRVTAALVGGSDRTGGARRASDVVQRMVAVAKKQTTTDFVENASIQFGLQRGGGPVGLLASLDYSTLEFGDQLFIVAHGKPGASGDYTANQIAAYLSNPNTGITANGVNVLFTSCNAGTATGPQLDDSVVATVSQALAAKGLANYVAGAKGASLKHDQVGGGAFTAIKEALIDKARDVQNLLKGSHDPQGEFDSWLKKHPRATAEEKADAASRIAQPFYEQLVFEVRTRNLHIDDARAVERRAHWG